MQPTKDAPRNKRPTHTEQKGLETNIPSNWGKKSQAANTHIGQNSIQEKNHKKRLRGLLHDTQGKNPSRRHNH